MLNPFPYQEEGADTLVKRARFGLHDEMGVGKTLTIWRAIEKLGAERAIIVCPAHLRENWIGEYRKFIRTPRRLCKGKNIHDMYAWLRGRFHYLITSYEQAAKWAPHIVASGEMIDAFAIDEAHYLKNGDAARTKALLGPAFDGHNGAITWAQHVYHVTGTPMANDPLDIYTFLRMCEVMPLSKEAFIKRYFHQVRTRFGSRQEPKPEMIAELKALIRNNSLRRTQEDVGLQLPPIFLTSVLVDGDTEAIKAMLKEYPGLERAIIQALEQGGLSFIDAQHVATLRRLIGEAKAIPYGHMLIDELQSGAKPKRVVMGIHQDALGMLHNFLLKNNIRACLVNGTTKERDDEAAKHAFQNDPGMTVFIGNIRKAGTGNTLTAACDLDVLESDWSPAGNAQAIKRVHRIGQEHHVRARFITLARSFDEVVNRIVAAKTATIANIEGFRLNAAPLLF